MYASEFKHNLIYMDPYVTQTCITLTTKMANVNMQHDSQVTVLFLRNVALHSSAPAMQHISQ